MRLGIVITNRNRPGPLSACLTSLVVQRARPQWVVLVDLGSSYSHRAALKRQARHYRVTYLRAEHPEWNKGLAFNTALKHMPGSSHVMQLDADMILHPHLLQNIRTELSEYDCIVHVPRDVHPRVLGRSYSGNLAAFERLHKKSTPRGPYCVGGCATFPWQWLMDTGGIDEEFIGWGNQDMEIWGRAKRALRTRKDMSGARALHQSHAAIKKDPEQIASNLRRREAHDQDGVAAVNPDGFGEGQVSEVVHSPVGRSAGHPRTRRGRSGP